MEPLDLREASFSEVLARVSFRLITRDYAGYPKDYERPGDAMLQLAGQLTAEGWAVMGTWVLAYAVGWSELTPIAFIREGMVWRARSGDTWRRVAYPDYKGTRGADPRVTNRGVSSPRRQTRGQ